MLFDLLIDGLIGLVKLVFGLLPDLPQVPATIQSYITQFLDMLFQGMGLIDVVIDLTVFKAVLVVTLVVFQFDNLWKLTMFILKKIPFVNIK